MNNILSLSTASIICLGAAITTSTQATEVDCTNYWINPKNNLVQCFDSDLNYISLPSSYLTNSTFNSVDSVNVLRRNTSNIKNMIMPDLVGQKIDAAEDYLLGMGVILGSEQIYVQNKATGEVIQQTPTPGSKLTKGQTVLLQYMGARVNPLQVK